MFLERGLPQVVVDESEAASPAPSALLAVPREVGQGGDGSLVVQGQGVGPPHWPGGERQRRGRV